MPKKDQTTMNEIFMTIWIVVRVILILVVWLALFLALFLGIFTVPIIVVIVLAAVYALSDLIFVVANQMRTQAMNKRKEMIEEQLPDEDEDVVV
ncbi:MAG: hypothetical protein CVU39_16600 [Chloroflexi bacterium HGW-Chloroflexi-10]|nr:MAG: hypothetical protein CVU39_16600 [Chloroflexi bacterium HGW-Chloroflexi-10]